MKLSESVFYREYIEKTFVIDTNQHRTFRFDAPLLHLFDLFSEEIAIEEAKQRMLNRYPNTGFSQISDDVERMAAFLRDNHLLSGDDISGDMDFTGFKPNLQFFQIYTIREKLLYSVMIELTYRCPEKCIHCFLEPSVMLDKYADIKDTELSTQEIYRILDQLAEMNVMCVTFTGGEPFVRYDIFEILEYARKKNLVIDIFSNGILLNDEDICRLKQLHINCFHSSIYSLIPQKHDAVIGVTGSFEKTIRTLRALSQKGVYVNIKYVLMEQNKDDFVAVADFANSIGASIQLIPNVSPSKRGNCGTSSLSVRDDGELKKAFRCWDSIIGVKTNTEFSVDETPICKAGRNCISINPYGIVTPCNAFEYEIGDLRKSTVAEIWHNSEKLKWWQQKTVKDLDECQGCQYFRFCGFCPGNALKVTGRMFGRVEEACRQAKIRYDLHHQKSNISID